jgi:hypothetical protein
MNNTRIQRYCLLGWFVTASLNSIAQPDSVLVKPVYFYSFHTGGLFAKENAPSLSVSTIHGMRHKRIAVGLGIGYDAYTEWRSMPVFASLSYDLSANAKPNAFFIQLNAGLSKAWVPDMETGGFNFKEKGGTMVHPLLGYRIRTEKFSLYFTGGYKFQILEYEQSPNWWIWGYTSSKTTVNRKVERLSIQIGFGLN